MIDMAFSLWNFKPDERTPFPSLFPYANGRFMATFGIVRPEDIWNCLGDFPEIADHWDQISPWVTKADLARLLYVYTHAGFYFDSDVEILRRFPETSEPVTLFTETVLPTTEVLGIREDKSLERRHRIANYAFGCTQRKHPFFKACIEECIRRLKEIEWEAKSPQDVLWVCGPDVITSIYHSNQFSARVLGVGYVKHRAVGSWRDQTYRR